MTQLQQNQKKDQITVDCFILDRIIIGSQPHKIINQCQSIYCEAFPEIIGFQSDPKPPKQEQKDQQKQIQQTSKLSLIGVQQIHPFLMNNMQSIHISNKIKMLKNYIESLEILQKMGLFSARKDSQILYCNHKKQLRIKYYYFENIAQFKPPNHNDAQEQFGVEFCGKNVQITKQMIQKSNIWRWGIFASKLFYQFRTSDYFSKIKSGQQVVEKQPSIDKLINYPLQRQFIAILLRCMNIMPSKRPLYSQIKELMQNLTNIYQTRPSKIIFKTLKQAHIIEKERMNSTFSITFSEQLLLTEDLRKKLSSQFLKMGLKNPKEYKPLFRAKKFNFSPDMFYQYCAGKSKLLFLIDVGKQQQSDTLICVFISPLMHLREELGIFGHYIGDTKLQSFIYSPKNQESYKLLNKDQAFRVCHGYGPIIGDGDIILKGVQRNQCKFPQSYQTGKHKKLPLPAEFRVRNYDVYEVIMGK